MYFRSYPALSEASITFELNSKKCLGWAGFSAERVKAKHHTLSSTSAANELSSH